MKKIILSIVCFVMLLLFTVTVEAVSYDIHVEVEGDGAATYIKNDDTVTLTCEEKEEPFVFWNVHGEYEIVEGYYEDKEFTIRPLSDITACATYESAVPHTAIVQSRPPDMTSPKTGDDLPFIAVVMIFYIVFMAWAIIYELLNGREKHNDDEDIE